MPETTLKPGTLCKWIRAYDGEPLLFWPLDTEDPSRPISTSKKIHDAGDIFFLFLEEVTVTFLQLQYSDFSWRVGYSGTSGITFLKVLLNEEICLIPILRSLRYQVVLSPA